MLQILNLVEMTLAFDKGNYDHDHGCIQTKEIRSLLKDTPYHQSGNIKDIEKRQYVQNLEKEVNTHNYWDHHPHIAYCELFNPGAGFWAHQRKQHTSSIARRHYKSSANKKTRQKIKRLNKEELEDINE